MPFIGKQPQVGAYSKLDLITTSATATYNLTLDSGAYYPQSANHLLVSLNGVMQAPQDSFTISGSTITFASALTSSDNIDFIMALGDTLDIGVPSAGSVNTSQLANDAVTTAKITDANITTAKIADDAITNAKIGSSAVTTAKINNGAITSAKLAGLTRTDMPSGSVLQVASAEITGEVSFTGTNIYSGLQASFTPISSSSKIFAIATIQNATSGTGRNQFYFRHGTTGGDNSGTKVGDVNVAQAGSASTTDLMSASLSSYFTSGTTSPLYVKMILAKHDGGTGYINKIGSNCTMTIMEIAV
jgi:hypothetical protein